MEFLTSFVKNGEIRPQFTKVQNNSRTTRRKKSTQFLKGKTHDLFKHILQTKKARI